MCRVFLAVFDLLTYIHPNRHGILWLGDEDLYRRLRDDDEERTASIAFDL